MDTRPTPPATTHSRLDQIRAKLAHYPANAPARLDTEWLIAMLEVCVSLIQGKAEREGEHQRAEGLVGSQLFTEDEIIARLEALRG
jgi:hypothetical protein